MSALSMVEMVSSLACFILEWDVPGQTAFTEIPSLGREVSSLAYNYEKIYASDEMPSYTCSNLVSEFTATLDTE